MSLKKQRCSKNDGDIIYLNPKKDKGQILLSPNKAEGEIFASFSRKSNFSESLKGRRSQVSIMANIDLSQLLIKEKVEIFQF